jgi:hypothetical protein
MSGDDGRQTGEKRRRERLSASLKVNLKRRRAQLRGRAIAADKPAVAGEAGEERSPEPKR